MISVQGQETSKFLMICMALCQRLAKRCMIRTEKMYLNSQRAWQPDSAWMCTFPCQKI